MQDLHLFQKISSNDQMMLIDEFSNNVKKGKGDSVQVYLVNIEESKKVIKKIIEEENAKNIIAYKTNIIEKLFEDLDLFDTKIFFEGNKTIASSADIGVSEVEFAIAETGTLVEYSYSIWKRLVSAMPTVYLAIASPNKIVKDLESAFSIIKNNIENNKHISFITGPSITADIERVLTIGVHGPSKVIVLFLKEF